MSSPRSSYKTEARKADAAFRKWKPEGRGEKRFKTKIEDLEKSARFKKHLRVKIKDNLVEKFLLV